MVTNYLLQGRRYSRSQVLAVLLVTTGIVLATLSAPPKPSKRDQTQLNAASAASGFDWVFLLGIGLLTGALVLSALMGIWQEKTYKLHGDAWQEGLFYSVSLPSWSIVSARVSSLWSLHRGSRREEGGRSKMTALPGQQDLLVIPYLSSGRGWRSRFDLELISVRLAVPFFLREGRLLSSRKGESGARAMSETSHPS